MSDFGSKKKENHQNFAGNPFLRVRKIQKLQKIQQIQKNTKIQKIQKIQKLQKYKKILKNPISMLSYFSDMTAQK